MELKSRFGFTLAEVLITLGVIGVVAAMTMPTLIAKYQERQTVSQLKKVYSVFSQAYLRATEANGSIDNWDLGDASSADGALNIYNKFKPYLSIIKDCEIGGDTECGPTDLNYYKPLSGTGAALPMNQLTEEWRRGILNDGTMFAFYSSGNAAGSGVLVVDINGLKKPNQSGVDYFMFGITAKKGVVPSGRTNEEIASRCKYNMAGNGFWNGMGCTAWVIFRENMDYRKHDISW